MLPLSMGIKEGDNIRCRYHGLLINSEGFAVEMPIQSASTRASAPKLTLSLNVIGSFGCGSETRKKPIPS